MQAESLSSGKDQKLARTCCEGGGQEREVCMFSSQVACMFASLHFMVSLCSCTAADSPRQETTTSGMGRGLLLSLP